MWETLRKEEVLKKLKTNRKEGLTNDEVKFRQEKYGENQLSEKNKETILKKFIKQFQDFMIIILIIASIVSAGVSSFQGENDYIDSVIILAIVILNSIMGVIQEVKAEKAIEALKQMTPPKAKVIREGKTKDINAKELVPGDMVILEAGNIVPADCRECEQVIKFAAENYGPMYIRIPRTNVCDIFDENYEFDFCKARVIEDGTDVTIITNGETLAEVIEACENLKKSGYSAQIIHVPVVKPLDGATIIENVKKTRFVMTVENHSITGGLGSAICELLAEYYPLPVHRIGVNDNFGQSGKWDFLLDYYGLSSEKLTITIKKYIDKYRLIQSSKF